MHIDVIRPTLIGRLRWPDDVIRSTLIGRRRWPDDVIRSSLTGRGGFLFLPFSLRFRNRKKRTLRTTTKSIAERSVEYRNRFKRHESDSLLAVSSQWLLHKCIAFDLKFPAHVGRRVPPAFGPTDTKSNSSDNCKR